MQKKNKKIITCESSLEEALEAIKPKHKNRVIMDMNVTALFHPTFHRKDTSSNKLQTIFNATCYNKFQDLLKID